MFATKSTFASILSLFALNQVAHSAAIVNANCPSQLGYVKWDNPKDASKPFYFDQANSTDHPYFFGATTDQSQAGIFQFSGCNYINVGSLQCTVRPSLSPSLLVHALINLPLFLRSLRTALISLTLAQNTLLMDIPSPSLTRTIRKTWHSLSLRTRVSSG